MLERIYHHKWCPRVFYKKHDGGKKSGVTGYMLIEWKPVVSIGLLHFSEGSREAFHSHAFNAVTWWLKGSVTEEIIDGKSNDFTPSIKPKYTPRSLVHRVVGHKSTWAFTLRGPWMDTWYEIERGIKTVLTHGREILSSKETTCQFRKAAHVGTE